jgi:hypothetical protein
LARLGEQDQGDFVLAGHGQRLAIRQVEKRYVEVDLHRNQFTVCVRLENGRTYLREWKLAALPQFVKKLRATDEVAVEGTSNTKGSLPEVRMKDKQHGQIASLTQTRDTLVKPRTVLKNKVNNILSGHGINLAKEALSSEKKLDEVLTLPFEELVELRVIVAQIRSLNQSIRELDQTIAEEGSKLERTSLASRASARSPEPSCSASSGM